MGASCCHNCVRMSKQPLFYHRGFLLILKPSVKRQKKTQNFSKAVKQCYYLFAKQNKKIPNLVNYVREMMFAMKTPIFGYNDMSHKIVPRYICGKVWNLYLNIENSCKWLKPARVLPLPHLVLNRVKWSSAT